MAVEKIKLGTRRSLLAWAQSGWVARELERLNPGLQVELVGIDTRGDKILDISLRNVVGKEFFVAELDEALKSGAVDLSVHSMKDLSLDRPVEFALGAIPRRENPRDVILFGPRAMEGLASGRPLKIGTSSPRRLENIPPFLAQALPRAPGAPAPRVELVEIRGNVNTRLARVHEPAGSDRALDGVVLAFAGLIRLWADGPGRAELSKLLKGARWMVLPLRECPAAPAQGALAVECRAAGAAGSSGAKDALIREALAKLHDPATAEAVARERQILADWGGGCHQRFGATATYQAELGPVLYVRGRKSDDSYVEESRWKAPSPVGPAGVEDLWNGKAHRAASSSSLVSEAIGGALRLDGRAVFASHWRALPEAARTDGARVWASGTASWFRLAARGVWVEGCAEGMGFEYLEPTIREGVLQLPAFGPEWVVLTHEAGAPGWGAADVKVTYRVPVEAGLPAAERERMARARYFFWSSGSQFDQYGEWAPVGAHHACGPGKTVELLRSRGIDPTVFPSPEEWERWLMKGKA